MTDTNPPTFDAAGRGRTERSGSENRTVAIRWTAGIVLVVFGAGKYVNHATELASFRGYSLPAPAVAVYVIGAIVASGLARGEYISLTLAPVVLLAMIFLIGVGDGGRSLIGTVTPRGRGGHRGR